MNDYRDEQSDILAAWNSGKLSRLLQTKPVYPSNGKHPARVTTEIELASEYDKPNLRQVRPDAKQLQNRNYRAILKHLYDAESRTSGTVFHLGRYIWQAGFVRFNNVEEVAVVAPIMWEGGFCNGHLFKDKWLVIVVLKKECYEQEPIFYDENCERFVAEDADVKNDAVKIVFLRPGGPLTSWDWHQPIGLTQQFGITDDELSDYTEDWMCGEGSNYWTHPDFDSAVRAAACGAGIDFGLMRAIAYDNQGYAPLEHLESQKIFTSAFTVVRRCHESSFLISSDIRKSVGVDGKGKFPIDLDLVGLDRQVGTESVPTSTEIRNAKMSQAGYGLLHCCAEE